MCKHKKLTNDEFQFLQQYKPYATNHAQQQKQKLNLLDKVIATYKDTFYNLKKTTRQTIEMICWFAAEKGYCFAKDDYFSDRFNVSSKTVRNIFKKLRDNGIIQTVYRHSTKQNGLGAPVHLFVAHPYFSVWMEKFNLTNCQTDCQAENAEIPCDTKHSGTKKVSTKNISISKKLFKNIRKKIRLDYTYTPQNVPESFINTVKPFWEDATSIYTLWGKVKMSYSQFSLTYPVEDYTNLAIDAFKQSLFAEKNNKIKKDFYGYFYGTLKKIFWRQKAKESFENNPLFYNWLDENEEEISFVTN
ncbi:hypothetical protein AC623_20645 [Bacillus sp. FJAT-27231]|uniref:helix-turn-helix domain-containing protein n=1 Tax=Bacillus sp. FJAT-27231 TaxID=1679168 RepID=UPI0006707F1D|nr:helix-turn-helix domain-containing protein [Bacillus sp. FJAT-27231]KMY52547.1 hypothetical protein AC623_20645 [Bacillus sp. FJAT-27231]